MKYMWRVLAVEMELPGVRLDKAKTLLVNEKLDPAEQYVVLRSLMPEADPSLLQSFIDQITPPTVEINGIALDSEV